MSSGVLLRHEVTHQRAVGLQREGNDIRQRALKVNNKADAVEVERIKNTKSFQVKGRVTATGRYVYDVFRIRNDGLLELCGSDFPFFEEAAYFAADLLAGKTRVAMPGIGNVHLGQTRSGLFVPTQPKAGPKQQVSFTRQSDGSVVFRK